LVLGALGVQADNSASGYRILKKVSLKGNTGWDYLTVDAVARRLYVSHENQVLVLDADKLKKIGSLDGLDHCHGIAIAPEFHKGFITNGGDGTVVVFDTRTLKRLDVLKAEKDADGIQYDPATQRIFAFNGESGNSTVIDAETLKIISTVDLGGKPESAAVGSGERLFDDLVDKDQVVELDTKNLKILHRWSTQPGSKPAGLAMDVAHGRLFAACRNNNLVVLDSSDGHLVQTLPIGDRVDAAAFDPNTGNVFTSNGDGTLTVIHEDEPNQYRVVENVPTEKGARTMALDTKTGRVFSDTAETLQATPGPGEPKGRRKIVPGTFHLLVVGPKP
jgi:YVTN family beta-propeller protein